MTDRICSVTVLLEGDMRIDDAQALIAAISMIKGVAKVMPGQPVNSSDIMNRALAAMELRAKLFAALEIIP